ncbi:MAG: DUF5664 domain-containing protein [Candidatus Bilamarchaeaceae archaeon]
MAPVKWAESSFEDRLFSSLTQNLQIANDILSYPGMTELLITTAHRLMVGHKKYGMKYLKSAGRGRFSPRALIEHAMEHLRKLEHGEADDQGTDPRHHIGAVIVNLLILNYYLSHHREALNIK